ncbi:MAG: TIGR03557 family F420-dependent LLM class oxidoreductase [Actinobacteria bacterium]|nr:TIGR03557 family F420-dependent LLM class oxidoreductase [Actinomycetota bacterium]
MTISGPGDTGSSIELGYWLSSEEHRPPELVENAVRAEAAGFATAMISDHFHPWTRQQGQASFVWSVLGAIAHATTELELGTGVTAAVLRMHPTVVAQATATTATLMPGRFFLGLGSGERLSEHVVGRHWPSATVRRDMLEEAVGIIRKLLAGGNVNHAGDHFTVENAELFTRPDVPPSIMVAGGGKRGAALAGRVGDGLIGVVPSGPHIEAFENAGGTDKPAFGQLHVCFAADEADARRTATRWWPNGAIEGAALTDLARPGDFEKMAALVREDDVSAKVVCGPDPERYIEAIGRFASAGFTRVYLHQVGPDQDGFLRFYTDELAPAFAR